MRDPGPIRRAIEHHERSGTIHHASPPGHGQPRWRIRLTPLDDPLDLTWREAEVLCLGISAGRLSAQRTTDEVPR